METFRATATLDAVQPPYNLFEREIEASIMPHAKNAGLTVLSYGVLCRGLLTGKITIETKFEGDNLRKLDPKFQGLRFMQYFAAVDELSALARDRFGKSMLALAVRWVLDQGPTIALWGRDGPISRLHRRDRRLAYRRAEQTRHRRDPRALLQRPGLARFHGAARTASARN